MIFLAKFVNKYTRIGIVIIFLSIVLYYTWTLDRGFDITDESYYVLLAMQPSDVKIFNSAQHWITAPLWEFSGSLPGFRAVGLIILLLSALVLSLGAINAYRNTSIRDLQRWDYVIITVSAMSSALLYGATINFSPCYNLLVASGAYLSTGLVFLTIGKPAGWRVNVFNLLAGCALSITFLNKFSSGVALLFLIITLLIFLAQSKRVKIVAASLIIFGLIIFTTLIILSHAVYSDVFNEFKLGMAVFKSLQVESTYERLIRYAVEFLMQLIKSGLIFVIPIAFMSTYKERYLNLPRYKTFALIGTILLFFVTLRLDSWIGQQSAVMSTVLAISLILTANLWTKNLRSIFLTIGLLILPYCCAFGTGNSIHTQIVTSLAPWGIVIALFGTTEKYRNTLGLLTSGIIVWVIAMQVIYSSFIPYHQGSSIWKQTIPTKIGAIGTIKTDEATNKFVLSLTNAATNCKIDRGRAFIGFYSHPGVALIIQSTSILTPWLTTPGQSEVVLDRVYGDTLRTAVIGIRLLQDGKMPPLPKYYSTFPLGYKMCGEAIYPYKSQRIQLWMPD